MTYRQIALQERYALAVLFRQGLSAVARALGRAPSTLRRELRRNATRYDGSYRYLLANHLRERSPLARCPITIGVALQT
jgi:IS30 family transposase